MDRTPDSKPDDQALWAAFRQGDEQAFETIVEGHFKRLFNYGSRFSADREFVKDCIQELFFEMWTRRETLGDTSFIKFYLFKSLRRKIYRETTKNAAANQETDLEWASENLGEESVEHEIIDIESMQEKIQRINQYIRQLPKRQQEAIHLKFFEELDNEEIAQIMSVTKQVAANMIYRAIRDIKASIQ